MFACTPFSDSVGEGRCASVDSLRRKRIFDRHNALYLALHNKLQTVRSCRLKRIRDEGREAMASPQGKLADSLEALKVLRKQRVVVNRRRDALRFHIELLGIEPAIWRELLVPARYSFWDLHVVIQDAMGWRDCHLHEFHVSTHGGSPSVVFGIPDDDDGFDSGYQVHEGWEPPAT